VIDPILRLAKLRVIQASAEIEAELSLKRSFLIPVLNEFREKAAESLVALTIVAPTDAEKVRTLQNEVSKYYELFDALRDIVAKGMMYEQEISDAEREEYLDMLVESPEGQRQALEEGLVDDRRHVDQSPD
jgi:hypothetical protein